MPPALAVDGLQKAYGPVTALRGVDLEIAEGELFGLLGPNGAGKSTLVKAACGLVRPTAGSVRIAGAAAGSAEANAALGYLAELFRFPDWCTAEEVLELHQRLSGSAGGEAERAELLATVGLGEAAGRRVGTMSKGMQQRLGIAQAMIGAPRLLLLDEPTSALDPAGRRTVRRPAGSRALVGSSRSSSRGLPTRAWAIPRRCCMPLDIASTRRADSSARPTRPSRSARSAAPPLDPARRWWSTRTSSALAQPGKRNSSAR